MRKLLLVLTVLVSIQCFSYETLVKGVLYRTDTFEAIEKAVKELTDSGLEVISVGGRHSTHFIIVTKPKQELTRKEKIIKLSELLGISLMRAELIYNKEVKK